MPYNYNPGNARDLDKSGTWFRDREGRFASFRGVNFSGNSKLASFNYLPIRMRSFQTSCSISTCFANSAST
jgi:hypothetical protein